MNNMKRSKKPMPLFGLFRKNKPDPIMAPEPPQLGSGVSAVPFNSILSPTYHHYDHHQQDPYSPPRIIKPSVSDSRRPRQSPQQQQQHQQKHRTRQRSKSLGRDPSTAILEERELALNKLCKRESPSSLVDSLPLSSPTYTTTPPVPPIPLKHQPNSPSVRKFSSAHDLRKATKVQQPESMHHQHQHQHQHQHHHQQLQQQQIPPLPKQRQELCRSKSLSGSPRKLQSSKSHQQFAKSPSRNYKKPIDAAAAADDDDDIPLGYLQSPTSKPSSLLNDQEEDDDQDLVPIAILDAKPTEEFQTAADKYKSRVKERLQFNSDAADDDDDDIPISLTLMSPKWKKKK